MNQLQRELEVARLAANRAGELALRLQAGGLRAESKSDESPVTIADRECERMIVEMLSESFPEDGFLGEEGAVKPSVSGRRWIIDPIDGTRDFVRGNPVWAVLIGLEEEGRVVAGVAHLPVLGDTYFASAGDGAYRNDDRIRVSGIADPASAVLSVNGWTSIGRAHFAPELLDWISQFWSVRCFGGCLDAMMLAAGQMEVWIEPKVAPWDLAAPKIILEEAGARFFDFAGVNTIYGGNSVACTPGLEPMVRDFLDRRQTPG